LAGDENGKFETGHVSLWPFSNHDIHCLWRWSKVRTEGSPGHLFPLDTLETVANEWEGAAELKVLALGGLEYDIQFRAMYTQRLGHQWWQWAFTQEYSNWSSILWSWNMWWVRFLWNLPETCRETWFWGSLFASMFGMSLCLLVSCFSLFLPLFLSFFLSLDFSFFISLCISLSLFILLSLLLSLCLSHSVCVSLWRSLSKTFTLVSFKISHTWISFPCFRGSSLDFILRFNFAFPCQSSALSCVLVHDVCAHTFSFSCISYTLTGSLFHLRNSPADVSGSSQFYWAV
jgi:hypothetical protein